MLATLLLLTATALGLCVAALPKVAVGPWVRVGMGIVVGQLLLLSVPFVCALAFDLPARVAGISAIAVFTGWGMSLWRLARRAASALAWREGLRSELFAPHNRPVVFVGALFVGLFAWLLHTHYMLPLEKGIYSAGVTWGDLPIHLGLASRFLYAEGLPPLEHPLILGGPLAYPFLPDYLVAVLAASGLSLRWAFILAGIVPLCGFMMVLCGLAQLWSEERGSHVAALGITLFFLAGGLGFWSIGQQLLAGASPLELLASTNATDLPPHIRKSGHVGNLFIAARTASFGMPVGATVLLLLGHLLVQQAEPDRASLVIAGWLAGSLPLVHSHSFIVISGAVGLYVLLGLRFRFRWLYGLLPLLLAALPQVGWLLDSSPRSFVRMVPGFLRRAPSVADWFIDLSLGMGLWLLLVPFAVFFASPRARRLTAPLLLLLPLANLVTFTPAVYDNVKLLAWFDLAAASLLAALLVRLSRRRFGLGLSAVAVVGCTLSGGLAVGHELTNRSILLPNRELALIELVRRHTAPEAVVATAASYHDPVAMLSGRRVLISAPFMLETHGIEVRERARDLVQLYAGGRRALEVIGRYGVDAVVVGTRERRIMPRIDEAFLAKHSRATYDVDRHRLYVLRD